MFELNRLGDVVFYIRRKSQTLVYFVWRVIELLAERRRDGCLPLTASYRLCLLSTKSTPEEDTYRTLTV